MSNKILIVCDVEGTVFNSKGKIEGSDYEPSLWQRIAIELGDKAVKEEIETQRKWDNGGYNRYSDWVKATVGIHMKYGLSRYKFQHIIDQTEYMPGVKEFFLKLDRNKYIPVLVSGGFQELAARAARELNIEPDNVYASCSYVFDNTGKMIDAYIRPNDFEGKIAHIRNELKNHHLDFEKDWIFVGDSKSDALIAEKAPKSFAINAHKDMQKAADKSINSLMDAYKDIEQFYKKNQEEKSETKSSEQVVDERLSKEQEIKILKERNKFLEAGVPKPKTAEDIIHLVKLYYKENIIFSDEAEETLIKYSKSGYSEKDINHIFDHLKAINDWAKMKKNEITQNEFNQTPNSGKIKPAVSESTEGMYKSSYRYKGVDLDMHSILSLSNHRCPRIYFGWDKNHNKVLIGPMCQHLKTSQYKF